MNYDDLGFRHSVPFNKINIALKKPNENEQSKEKDKLLIVFLMAFGKLCCSP